MLSPREDLLICGVDPSTTATGVALLCVRDAPGGMLRNAARRVLWSPGPDDVTVVLAATIRPKGKFHERVVGVQDGLLELLPYTEAFVDVDLLVVEDPTDFGQPARRANAGKVGAAFGAAVCAVYDLRRSHTAKREEVPLLIIPSQSWIPQTRSGGWTHPMKHADARELMRRRWPALAATTDHVTFAAGVALYGLTGQRLATL